MLCPSRRPPYPSCLVLQFNDEFIEAYIRCTSDELPLPQCALTLSFIELMGGKLKHTQAPVGLKEGGTSACTAAHAGALRHAVEPRYCRC